MNNACPKCGMYPANTTHVCPSCGTAWDWLFRLDVATVRVPGSMYRIQRGHVVNGDDFSGETVPR